MEWGFIGILEEKNVEHFISNHKQYIIGKNYDKSRYVGENEALNGVHIGGYITGEIQLLYRRGIGRNFIQEAAETIKGDYIPN